MKTAQPKPAPQPEPLRRPWGTIVVGSFLLLFGIGASIYGYIAITWTPESSSEVIQFESSPGVTSIETRSDATNLDPDAPIRTSTTRRRTTPFGERSERQPVPTTVADETDGSGTTSFDGQGEDNSDVEDEDLVDDEDLPDDEDPLDGEDPTGSENQTPEDIAATDGSAESENPSQEGTTDEPVTN